MWVLWVLCLVTFVLVVLSLVSLQQNGMLLQTAPPAVLVQPVNRGGTGAITANEARASLGLTDLSTMSVVPVDLGGTGATSAPSARTALGLSDVATYAVVPLASGGTGVTTLAEAQSVLLDGWSEYVQVADNPLVFAAEEYNNRVVYCTYVGPSSEVMFTLPVNPPNNSLFRLLCSTLRNMRSTIMTGFQGPVFIDDGGVNTKAMRLSTDSTVFYFLEGQILTFTFYNGVYYLQGYPQIAIV